MSFEGEERKACSKDIGNVKEIEQEEKIQWKIKKGRKSLKQLRC